jgi:alcohol dehydrogenase (NADP+)
MKGDDEPRLLDDPTIQAVAERRDASPAQVLISWAVHRNTAVIPKSVTPSHIEDNLAAADVALTDEDMEAIGSVERSYRYVGGELWTIEGSPYTLAGLWDE